MTLDKFVVVKQLTKRLEEYPDAKNQPHVQVALRRKAAHKRDGTMQARFLPCEHSPRMWLACRLPSIRPSGGLSFSARFPAGVCQSYCNLPPIK